MLYIKLSHAENASQTMIDVPFLLAMGINLFLLSVVAQDKYEGKSSYMINFDNMFH